jgi:hypothetical protein
MKDATSWPRTRIDVIRKLGLRDSLERLPARHSYPVLRPKVVGKAQAGESLGTDAATPSRVVRLAARDSSAFHASRSYHAPAPPFLPASASCSTPRRRGPRLPAPGGHRRPRRQAGPSLAPRSCLQPPAPPRGGVAPACRRPAAAVALAGR